MAGVLLGSALEEAVKKLPKALKPESVVPELKKLGVKDEELQMSGIGVLLPEYLAKEAKDAKGRISGESIGNLVNYGRDDFFTTSTRGYEPGMREPGYSHVVPADVDAPTQNYKERVYRFENKNNVKSGSTHFGDDNYLMHARVWDDLIGDQDTRVVGEIQSDLHQRGLSGREVPGRQLVTAKRLLDELVSADLKSEDDVINTIHKQLTDTAALFDDGTFEVLPKETIAEWVKEADKGGKDGDYIEVLEKIAESTKTAARTPESPWKTSWARKGIENEIKQAIADGKPQIAIPIKNAGEFKLESTQDQIDRTLAATKFLEEHPLQTKTFKAMLKDIYPQLPENAIEYSIENLYGATDDIAVRDFLSAAAEKAGNHGKALESMYRSSGAQQWYETNIDSTAQKLAKQLGTESRIVNKGGIDYRVIDLAKPGVKEKADSAFKLYAGGGAVAYYMALQQGVGEEDINQYMLDQGFTEADISFAKENQAKVGQALQAGILPEDINSYLMPEPQQETKQEPPKLTTDSKEKQEAMGKLLSGEFMKADDLLAAAQVIKPNMSSVTTRLAAFFGDTSSVQEAEAAELAMIKNIKELMAKRGVEVNFQEGEWVAETPDGPVEITPNFLQSLVAEKGEFIGAAAGGIYGAVQGAALAPPTPWTKAAGALAGGLTGAVAGGIAGTELDYVYQSMKLQEDMSAEIAAHKALTASEAAAYGEVLGLGLYKFGGGLWKGALRVKNFLLDGNSEGARKALRDIFFLSEDEIDEIIQRFERVVDTTGMSRAQKEIIAVTTTLPGAEGLVQAAAVLDPTASRAVVKNISERADQLLKASREGATETARVLKQDLDSYVDDVKTFYNNVKTEAAQNPRNKYYKFNLEGVAVNPVLESLAEKIADPAIREKFLLQMSLAKRYTDNRTFSDLIELRQLVNEFRFNKRVTKPEDYKALDEVITNIDNKLEKGAKWLFGKDADRWIDDFATARKQYSEMKTVQGTALYRLVNRPGITPEAVSKAMLKYSDSLDGNYERVMSMLPKDMRKLAERDMISQLVNKYTAGTEEGLRATQFPMLAKDLSTRSFVDEESRQLVKAIGLLADTFKNDVLLSQSTGMFTIPKFQSYLTSSPAKRAEFALASTIFNEIQQRIPGSKASREIALVKNAAKFLETPLNVKSVQALKEEAKDLVSLDEQILAVQRAKGEEIASGLDQNAAMIKFYGNGKILKSAGEGAAAISLPAHRIASPEVVRQMAIQEGLSVDSKLLDDVLKRYGFKAAQYGSDKIRLLD